MEDGPEVAEGFYESGGKNFRIEENESWVWRVYDPDGNYLGVVTQSDPTPEDGYRYAARCAGEEDADVPTTDDWRSAIEHLIEVSIL